MSIGPMDRYFVFGGFCDGGLGANGFLGFFANFKDAQEFLRMRKRADGNDPLSWAHICDAEMKIVWSVDADDDTAERHEMLFTPD